MRRAPAKLLCMLLGVAGGWSSSLWLIDSVGSSPAGAAGNWRLWDLASGTSSNPYALAHFLSEGRVPPAQSLFRVYSSSTDDEGNRLSSICTYRISAAGLESRWWSLSVGPLDDPENDASAVITSEDVVRGADNSVDVVIARQPVAGNWIRPAAGGSVTIQLVVSNEGAPRDVDGIKLPAVQRVSC